MSLTTTRFVSQKILTISGVGMLYKAACSTLEAIGWCKQITLSEQEKLNTLIIQYDLEHNVRVLTQLCIELSTSTVKEIKSVRISIGSIASVLEDIDFQLTLINSRINNHVDSWFRYIRSLDISPELDRLEAYCKTLRDRIDLLFKVLSIHGINKSYK